MIVGEAPGEKEVEARRPFVGASGWLLDEALKEAGLARGMAFVTNVARERPPGNDIEEWVATTLRERTPAHQEVDGKWVLPQIRFGRELLRQEVTSVRPTVVIALGNLAMWALTGKWGIRKWRSSVLQAEVDGHKFKVIPAFHPTAVLREYPLRRLLVHDLNRARVELSRGPVVSVPQYEAIIRPLFPQAYATLLDLLTRLETSATPIKLAADIETRAGHTACLGLAWSSTEAICIPFMCVERDTGYWTLEEETELIILLRQILGHPRASLTWQNGAYDHQYEHRWHFIQPGLGWDTMLAQHSMFSISLKGLDFLSSLYCDYHVYWKDDGKKWDPSIPEDDFWFYNAEDCFRTYEIREAQEAAIQAMSAGWPELPSVVQFQHDLQPAVVRMMLRGVRSDDHARQRMTFQVLDAIHRIQGELETLVSQPINIGSNPQMTELFYSVLNQSPIYKRDPKTGKHTVTCDDEALKTIGAREPVLRPVVARIQALRSARVFEGTFLAMTRDVDGRLRSSYNVAGTKTYRFSSSENAFDSGGNLQNIPTGDEDDEDALILLPNIRKLFLFDPGMIGFDLDGDSADLRIVTGESGCRQMQAYFAAGVKPYVEIAKEFYRDPTITKHHPSYKRMKALCHGCLTEGHEVLTPRGWVDISQHVNEPIMTWQEDGTAIFETPSHWTEVLVDELVSFEGESYSAEMSKEHRVPYYTDTSGGLKVSTACFVPRSARMPMAGLYAGGDRQVSTREARLLAAFQADGSVYKAGHVTFNFKKQRKIKRLRQLLDDREFTESGGRFYIPRRSANFAEWGKTAGAYLLSWPAEALDAFLAELVRWDGWGGGTVMCHVSTVNKDHALWIQTIAKLRGYGSQVTLSRGATENRQDIYRVSLNRRTLARKSSLQETRRTLDTPVRVHCPTVSSGFFFVRRRDRIYVTGNSNYGGEAKGLSERIGLPVHDIERMQSWYFGMCPEIKRWQEDIINQFNNRGYIQNPFGYRLWRWDRPSRKLNNEALAWTPQSSVGILINKILLRIDQTLPWCQLLLQVHDSLTGQYPTELGDEGKRAILQAAEIPIHCQSGTIVIPAGMKTSTTSWGDCG